MVSSETVSREQIEAVELQSRTSGDEGLRDAARTALLRDTNPEIIKAVERVVAFINAGDVVAAPAGDIYIG